MNPDQRIFLGMPGYGQQSPFAGRALWRACADMDRVEVKQEVSSLLAQNFNALWCMAMNMAHQGRRVDYFAMIHDDIGTAKDGWLDDLIEELDRTGLDVLGVVVPIKDDRGLTSIALDDGDEWRLRSPRLSMYDIYQLPETFTEKDTGAPLLLNTGLWVCKFNLDWATRVHFEIRDRISFNRVTNTFMALNLSEDWNFSRQLNALGLKIGATRKIKCIHGGTKYYSNQGTWGTQAFDVAAVNVSPIPGAFPFDVPGWLKPEEGRALAELSRGKRVLEIGSFCGLSTICMARTAEHVTAVDYFDGRGTPNPGNTVDAFRQNIERYGVSHKIDIRHPAAELPSGRYDMALIDGAHDRPAVEADVRKCLAAISDDGLLVFHDYQSPLHPAVTEVVDDLIASGGSLISTCETLAVVRPPAEIPLEV